MQSIAATQANRAPEVAPALRPMAAWRVASVEVQPQARLRVSFMDGTVGGVDLRRFLQDPELAGTVFEPLRDSGFLAQAVVVNGAVTWPNGADLSPDAMYDAIRAQGIWNLE